jgi:hypothetical protein
MRLEQIMPARALEVRSRRWLRRTGRPRGGQVHDVDERAPLGEFTGRGRTGTGAEMPDLADPQAQRVSAGGVGGTATGLPTVPRETAAPARPPQAGTPAVPSPSTRDDHLGKLASGRDAGQFFEDYFDGVGRGRAETVDQ